MKFGKVLIALAATSAFATPASAADYIVDAFNNSSSGGTGVSTVALTAGDNFKVTVDPNDLWNAGALPRWSNADGLTGNRFATGTDDSGQPANTLIGINFGTHTQGNLTAPFGTLVGRIGSVYQVLGTNFSGPAWGTGTLQLYYWDSNNGDNSQFITASLTGVPEPATWAMMIMGFGLIGGAMRARKPAAAHA